MANELSKIKKQADDRTDLVDRLIEALEKKTGSGQTWLIRQIIDDLVDKMDKDGDTIKNTQYNKRLISSVDTIFNQFAKSDGLVMVKGVLDGIGQIVDFNENYFSGFAAPAKMGKIQDQVKADLGEWLGIEKNGKIKENGYLENLVSDITIRNAVKNIIMSSVVGQDGYNNTKKQLRDYIEGTEAGAGALKKYYRNFVYDTFSQVDRTNAKLFADQLGMRFAIYEGGIIKTSRIFCRKHNGKVFHRDEIAKFDITEARPPGYNPFTDLGGYGCRHHLNWVPDAVAFALRPELRTLYPKSKAA